MAKMAKEINLTTAASQRLSFNLTRIGDVQGTMHNISQLYQAVEMALAFDERPSTSFIDGIGYLNLLLDENLTMLEAYRRAVIGILDGTEIATTEKIESSPSIG